MYYSLTNFYQNHRRYVKSRDDNQYLGNVGDYDSLTSASSDCSDPFRGSKINGSFSYARAVLLQTACSMVCFIIDLFSVSPNNNLHVLFNHNQSTEKLTESTIESKLFFFSKKEQSPIG